MKTILLLLFATIAYGASGQYSKTYLFVGTYTHVKPDTGIYTYEFNSSTGNLSRVYSGKDSTNPSYLTLSTLGDYVYACTETKFSQDCTTNFNQLTLNKQK